MGKKLGWGAVGFLLGGPVGAAIGVVLAHRSEKRGNLQKAIKGFRDDIHKLISNTEEMEKTESWIRDNVGPRLKMNESAITVRELIYAYIERTPDVLERFLKATAWSNLEHEAAALLSEMLAYVSQQDDLIPDDIGLVGLLDDACFGMRIVAEMAPWLRHSEGETDLIDANDLVKQILPPDIRQALNNQISRVLEDSRKRQEWQALLLQQQKIQQGWQRSGSTFGGKDIIKESIYHDLATDGVYRSDLGV
jgi:hypothetical protein